jgi:aminobenzoyl-glutamate transport protein
MQKKNGIVERFLSSVERLGNKLPHPVTLFFLFAVGTVLLSGIGGWLEWSVGDPRPEGAPGRSPDGQIKVVSLMNEPGLRRILVNLVDNFVGFKPLGTVLVAMLGVSIAEHSSLLTAAIRFVVIGAPRHMVTLALVFAGVLSNTASEVGYVVIVPLGAVIFFSIGRHPLAGLAAAFAGVSGGYSANLLLGTVDPLLAGITEEAARLIDPEYEVHAAVNWYFMIGSTFLVTAMGTLVTSILVEPRLGKYDKSMADDDVEDSGDFDELSSVEKKGLLWTGITIGLMSLVLLYLTGLSAPTETSWPFYGSLRNPDTGTLARSALMNGVVGLIFIFFLIPGIVYGYVTGTVRSNDDIVDGMTKTMGTLAMYIVLVFFAAQFVEYFKWTNLGTLLAVVGANGIKALNMDNSLVFIPFVIICFLSNLLMGSASAKWAVTAPIFVPMLMLIGFSPEVVQCAYRIGDSASATLFGSDFRI